jgi:hypothetical protein
MGLAQTKMTKIKHKERVWGGSTAKMSIFDQKFEEKELLKMSF